MGSSVFARHALRFKLDIEKYKKTRIEETKLNSAYLLHVSD